MLSIRQLPPIFTTRADPFSFCPCSQFWFLGSGGRSSGGRVLDADTEQPIPFTTVTLLDPSDSTIVAGTVSGDGGGWSLGPAPRGGAMLLKMGFPGYDDTYLVLPTGGAAPSPIISHLRSGAQLPREITVRGATGFLLLLDGQPVQTDPAAILTPFP